MSSQLGRADFLSQLEANNECSSFGHGALLVMYTAALADLRLDFVNPLQLLPIQRSAQPVTVMAGQPAGHELRKALPELLRRPGRAIAGQGRQRVFSRDSQPL